MNHIVIKAWDFVYAYNEVNHIEAEKNGGQMDFLEWNYMNFD